MFRSCKSANDKQRLFVSLLVLIRIRILKEIHRIK